MTGFTDTTWMLLTLIAAFGMLQVLRSLAITVRNRVMIHDLKVNVSKLQAARFHSEMLRNGMTPRRAEPEHHHNEGADAPAGSGTAEAPIEVDPVDDGEMARAA